MDVLYFIGFYLGLSSVWFNIYQLQGHLPIFVLVQLVFMKALLQQDSFDSRSKTFWKFWNLWKEKISVTDENLLLF